MATLLAIMFSGMVSVDVEGLWVMTCGIVERDAFCWPSRSCGGEGAYATPANVQGSIAYNNLWKAYSQYLHDT